MFFKNTFSTIRQDLPASIVVFFVAMPLCLGIALASGAPLFSGIISGIVGGIIVGAMSNSPLGVSGPAAGLALIVLSAIQELGAFEIFLVAVVLAGVLQIVAGLLRGGIIANYFPSSVIKGMLTGIGIIIFLKQIPHALGYDADPEGDLAYQQMDGETTFSELGRMLDYISPGAVIVSLISLAILLFWDLYLSKKHNIFKIVQGPFVAVAVGIGYQLLATAFFPAYAISSQHLVTVPVAENATEFFSQFSFPDFSVIMSKEVWIVAATIAIVASLETLLCVEATDKLDPQKRVTSKNRELIAQGSGNILSGLIGGIPITQVIVRSSANIQSGGKSKLSAIFHGFFLLITVALIPQVLNMIPLAVLACILLIVGYKLAKPILFKEMYKLGWQQFIPFIVTVVGIVFTDLLIGISLGLAVGILFLLINNLMNSHAVEHVDSADHKSVTLVLAQEVSFLNKGSIVKELNSVEAGMHVIIDMSKTVSIDHDVWEVVNEFRADSEEKQIKVELIESPFLKKAS